jgi:hypothetical protein
VGGAECEHGEWDDVARAGVRFILFPIYYILFTLREHGEWDDVARAGVRFRVETGGRIGVLGGWEGGESKNGDRRGGEKERVRERVCVCVCVYV